MNSLDQHISLAFQSYKDRPFLVNTKTSVSYETCLLTINNLAELINPHISSQHPVAILGNNKMTSLHALLTCLLNQYPYIPLDKLAPIKRNLEVLTDNKIQFLIISKNIFEKNKNLIDQSIKYDLVDLIDIDSFLVIRKTKSIALPKEVAYILFTSGSTGRPKGIMISHQNAWSFINWANELIDKLDNKNFCSIAPFQFDLSVFDIYVSLLRGASLFLFESDEIRNPRFMTEAIDEYKINVIYTTPTVYDLVLQYGKINKRELTSLKTIIFAGEQMMSSTLEKLKNKCPKAIYYNFYGPTETNVCTFYNATDIDVNESKVIPIGQACPYAQLKINMTEDMKSGHLLVAGQSVFIGYLGFEDKTHCFSDEDQVVWYQTGDVVFLDLKDQLVYVGREDRLIKLNGYRIELEEIEHVITSLDNVDNCGVIIKSLNDGNRIIAYVASPDHSEAQKVLIKEACLLKLPHYMNPNEFILVDELPINSNSKLDYKTLNSW